MLNYAEALNELTTSYEIPSWDGTKVYTIARTEEELKKGIQPVRIRAGLPDYEVYGNSDEFRIKMKRERQIEFFAEGHRYWDLRRWCDAPFEESLPVYGCNVYSTNQTLLLSILGGDSFIEEQFLYEDVVLPHSLLCNETECIDDSKSGLDESGLKPIVDKNMKRYIYFGLRWQLSAVCRATTSGRMSSFLN